MILKETILSAFTERGTLLKWLKKVEAALNNAVLTNISVDQISETQIKLKFTFENGDFIESPVLTLPRGEKGEPGKDGLDGEGIAATIEVGTVTTGAPGTAASVTNVGDDQRAILNFVIPRGADGSAGVGFDEAEEISINDGAISIIAGDNGVNIEASFEIAVGDEILEIPSTMYLPLKGSESIVIDVDESGEFIDIHLDAVIAAKLGRVLLTPMSAPASVSLVAVDTSNAQTMLTIGEGLTIQGGMIKPVLGEGLTIQGGVIKPVLGDGLTLKNGAISILKGYRVKVVNRGQSYGNTASLKVYSNDTYITTLTTAGSYTILENCANFEIHNDEGFFDVTADIVQGIDSVSSYTVTNNYIVTIPSHTTENITFGQEIEVTTDITVFISYLDG